MTVLNAISDTLSSTFDAISNTFQEYKQLLPEHIPAAIFWSAGSSFAITAILFGNSPNLNVALFTGGLAATITTVGIVIQPIFRAFLKNPDKMDWFVQAIHRTCSIAVTQILINSLVFPSHPIDLMGNFVFTISSIALPIILHRGADLSGSSAISFIDISLP